MRMEQSKKCSVCYHINPEDSNFCEACGTKLEMKEYQYCQSCGSRYDKEIIICPACGMDSRRFVAQTEKEHGMTDSKAVKADIEKNTATTKPKKNTALNVAILICAIAVVACAGVVAYYFFEQHKGDAQGGQPTTNPVVAEDIAEGKNQIEKNEENDDKADETNTEQEEVKEKDITPTPTPTPAPTVTPEATPTPEAMEEIQDDAAKINEQVHDIAIKLNEYKKVGAQNKSFFYFSGVDLKKALYFPEVTEDKMYNEFYYYENEPIFIYVWKDETAQLFWYKDGKGIQYATEKHSVGEESREVLLIKDNPQYEEQMEAYYEKAIKAFQEAGGNS